MVLRGKATADRPQLEAAAARTAAADKWLRVQAALIPPGRVGARTARVRELKANAETDTSIVGKTATRAKKPHRVMLIAPR